MKWHLILCGIALSVTAAIVTAACPELYPNQTPITPHNGVVELCNSFYVTHYDESKYRVVFTSERLQPHAKIGSPTRLSSFRSDSRVKNGPSSARYEHTGYDRGHMVPAEDSSTNEQMADTFLMTNAVPQNPTLNRGAWKVLESIIRRIARSSTSDVYVVTIPVYPDIPTLIDNKIPVPTGIWKVLIDRNGERYFFADNIALSRVKSYQSVDWRKLIH
jgi:endonuclease G